MRRAVVPRPVGGARTVSDTAPPRLAAGTDRPGGPRRRQPLVAVPRTRRPPNGGAEVVRRDSAGPAPPTDAGHAAAPPAPSAQGQGASLLPPRRSRPRSVTVPRRPPVRGPRPRPNGARAVTPPLACATPRRGPARAGRRRRPRFATPSGRMVPWPLATARPPALADRAPSTDLASSPPRSTPARTRFRSARGSAFGRSADRSACRHPPRAAPYRRRRGASRGAADLRPAPTRSPGRATACRTLRRPCRPAARSGHRVERGPERLPRADAPPTDSPDAGARPARPSARARGWWWPPCDPAFAPPARMRDAAARPGARGAPTASPLRDAVGPDGPLATRDGASLHPSPTVRRPRRPPRAGAAEPAPRR